MLAVGDELDEHAAAAESAATASVLSTGNLIREVLRDTWHPAGE